MSRDALLRARRGRARPAILAMLALLMVVAHVLVVDRLGDALGAGLHAVPEPARLQAAFVRELQVDESSPAPAAAPAAPPPRAAARPVTAKAPEPAASAVPPEAPASSPADPPTASGEPPDPPAVASAADSPPPAPEGIAAAAPSASDPPAAAFAGLGAPRLSPADDWPLGTRLRYALSGYVRGEVLGHAQVEWLREGSRYQVHLDVVVGPSFAPAMQRRMTSDGEITEQGLVPRRYDEHTQIGFATVREATVLFEPGGVGGNPGAVTLANGRRLPGLPGVQDTASQFVQLTWLFATGRQALRAGALVELPVALPRRLDRWVYEVAGEEVLSTDAGRVRTWHLLPKTPPEPGTLSVEAWFAPGLQYLPVRMVIRNGKDDFIDLVIDRLPLQAEEAPQAGSVVR